jgi:hypothetical protein
MPRDGYFLESLNILISTDTTTFCVCANGFQGLSKAFHYPKQLLTFFCFFELLTNFENAYLSPPPNYFLCDWSLFSSADLSLDGCRENLQESTCHRRLPV